MRRRGFTLVEITVFSAVALIVIAGAWSFLQSGMRQSKATDTKVQGVQEVLLAARVIEEDLAHVYQDALHGMHHKRVPNEGVFLEFYRYHPDPIHNPGSKWGPLPLQKVSYTYRSKERKLLRAVDDGEKRALFGTFESADFWDMSRETNPPADRGLRPGPSIGFHLVSTPRHELRKKREDRDIRSRTILFGGTALERSSVMGRFPYWHRVPFFPENPPE